MTSGLHSQHLGHTIKKKGGVRKSEVKKATQVKTSDYYRATNHKYS